MSNKRGLPQFAPIESKSQYTPIQQSMPEPTPIEKTIAMLKKLKKWIYLDAMKDKYLINQGKKGKKGDEKYLNDSGVPVWRKEYNGQLEKEDREYLVNGIIDAIKVSKEITKEEEERIKNYINSILNKNKYFSDGFGDLVKLLDIKSPNTNPYIFSAKSPNILSNIFLYLNNPGMEPKLYTYNMTKGQTIDFLVSENKRNLSESELNEANDSIKNLVSEIKEKNDKIKDLESNGESASKEIKEKDILIEKLVKEIQIQQDRYDNLKEFNKSIMPTVNDFNQLKATASELLKRSDTNYLDQLASKYAADVSFRKKIPSIKTEIANNNKDFSDAQINEVIARALEKNNKYLKTVAANPDLFDRDMSNDTIQKENEQFQSKLRQQNLRYILPKFIERREKLVENTLNPNLLKGAFAI